ncbi:MAG: sulfotransferase [Candidatus Binatia bacterium]
MNQRGAESSGTPPAAPFSDTAAPPPAAVTGLAGRSRLFARLMPFNSPVWWARSPRLAEWTRRWIPLPEPSVLVLSLPRSGSSWVGETLGFARDAAYLREPVTQTYMMRVRREGPSFFELRPGTLPPGYRLAADSAFRGIPRFHRGIVTRPDQWRVRGLANRRVVVKEVNPLAAGWLIRKFHPRVIYLFRHPAAVAGSFHRLGWTGEQLESRFSAETLRSRFAGYERFRGSFWAQHGAMQAAVLTLVLEELAGRPDCRFVYYEELCAEPLRVFRELFDFAGLAWEAAIEAKISAHSRDGTASRADRYSTARRSAEMTDVWRRDLSGAAISDVRAGFLAYPQKLYSGPEHW